jgi:lactate permease
MWNIAAFTAGLMGLGATVLAAQLPFYRFSAAAADSPTADGSAGGVRTVLPFSLAIIPYALLILIVSLAELVQPVHLLLNKVRLEVAIPETVTALGFATPASAGQPLSLFGHAGALLLYTSIISYLLLASRGCYRPGSLRRILTNTVRSAASSSLGIAAMVGFALIMEQSGMTATVAGILSLGGPALYSFASPFIGLLGAFMTGSNTNSNVLFTGMQREAAVLLRLPVTLILGAQTSGGAIGGMLAPARIIVGASTAGLAGKEGQVLRRTVPCGLAATALVGLIVWLVAA